MIKMIFSIVTCALLMTLKAPDEFKIWYKKENLIVEYIMEIKSDTKVELLLNNEYSLNSDENSFLMDSSSVFLRPNEVAEIKNETFTIDEFASDIFKTKLDYPKLNYSVVVSLLIDENGLVFEKGFQRTTECIPCHREAIASIENFEWKPALHNGKSVKSLRNVKFMFRK